mmetsp:Transcript_28855/g.64522  ORF Transcript_28855/g.64522 Transcript_28855/m.64522 type:complete len:85 (+) Transcript_28855:78-332(+)
MGSDKRTTLPRRKSYHTKSNRMQVVKTPGGKLVMHVVKKQSAGPKCGDTGVQLHGVRHPVLPKNGASNPDFVRFVTLRCKTKYI